MVWFGLVWFPDLVFSLFFDYFVYLTRLVGIGDFMSFFNTLCKQIISLAPLFSLLVPGNAGKKYK